MISEAPPLSQAQDVTNKMKKAKGRSKNFTIQEDMLLISVWKNVSLDPTQGNNQTQQTSWSKITSHLNEHKTFTSERTSSSLCNRWSSIQLCVSKFQGFCNQIDGRNQSGVGEQDNVLVLLLILQFITLFVALFLSNSTYHWSSCLQKFS